MIRARKGIGTFGHSSRNRPADWQSNFHQDPWLDEQGPQTSSSGNEPGAEVSKEKETYKPKKQFAYRMCASVRKPNFLHGIWLCSEVT